MMAKMFYTLEETKAALGKSEEEVKQYAREGRLREFRDGPRLMFKADQVDQLKGELASGGGMSADLGPSDSGVGIALADTGQPSGTGIVSLADTDFGKSPGAGMVKDDTRLAEDLGLSGTIGGIPSPGRPSGTGSGLSGTTTGSRGGITVFDVDDNTRVDPMAQTSIGSGIQDQVNLEGVGSGSGLLDLARDRDDTSLGAELLDEITPSSGGGGGGRRQPAMMAPDSALDMGDAFEPQSTQRGPGRSAISAPIYVEQHDPWATAFGALALFGVVIVLFGGFLVVNAINGVRPDFVVHLTGTESKGMVYIGAALVGSLVFFVVGWLIGKATAPARR